MLALHPPHLPQWSSCLVFFNEVTEGLSHLVCACEVQGPLLGTGPFRVSSADPEGWNFVGQNCQLGRSKFSLQQRMVELHSLRRNTFKPPAIKLESAITGCGSTVNFIRRKFYKTIRDLKSYKLHELFHIVLKRFVLLNYLRIATFFHLSQRAPMLD